MSSDNPTFRKVKQKIYNIMPIRTFSLLSYRRRLKYIKFYSTGFSRICRNNLEISKEELVACLDDTATLFIWREGTQPH